MGDQKKSVVKRCIVPQIGKSLLDRGYFSADNIKYFDQNGYGFLLMAKGNALFIREAIDTVKASLRMSSKFSTFKSAVDEYEAEIASLPSRQKKQGRKPGISP